MKYNPRKHHRRSIRLKGYDYAQAGLYFITICCQDRICRFGYIENDEMILNEYGKIAHDEWVELPNRFSNVELDAFVVMPNHIHGIIRITAPAVVGATLAVAPTAGDDMGAGASPAPTRLSDIVGAYKSLVANGCLGIYKTKNKIMGKLWQRNYWEHIIRNENDYQRIAQYIIDNPKKWEQDKLNKK